MIIIKVKDGESIERALKRYKTKFRKIKVLDELRENKKHTKKSEKKRKQKEKAKYVNRKQIEENED